MTLRLLRRLDQKMDRVIDDLGDVKVRLSAVERGLGELQVQVGTLNSRVDRLENRVERIERRLDLHDDSVAENQTNFEGPRKGPKT